MIAFRKNFGENYPEKGYKKLIKALFDDPFVEGTVLKGLHPDHITELIKHIIYNENHKKVNFTVALDSDGYHLKLKINRKGK